MNDNFKIDREKLLEKDNDIIDVMDDIFEEIGERTKGLGTDVTLIKKELNMGKNESRLDKLENQKDNQFDTIIGKLDKIMKHLGIED